jgi:hypothetical protein
MLTDRIGISIANSETPQLLTTTYVESSVTWDDTCKYIALGDADYDTTTGTSVSEKLLIVVLADGQEVVLSLHGDELLHVRKALLEFRGTALVSSRRSFRAWTSPTGTRAVGGVTS